MLERGGVLLRYADGAGGSALAFIPADVATRLVALTSLTEIPGARPPLAGIALADGSVVTVLDISGGVPAPRASLLPPPPGSRPAPRDDLPVPGANRAVLCSLGGLEIAILGGTVITTGVFHAAGGGDGVFWRGELVPALDVRALYAQAETAIWAERAASRATSLPPRSASPSAAPRSTRGDGS